MGVASGLRQSARHKKGAPAVFLLSKPRPSGRGKGVRVDEKKLKSLMIGMRIMKIKQWGADMKFCDNKSCDLHYDAEPVEINRGYVELESDTKRVIRHYPYRKITGKKVEILFFCETCKEAVDMIG